MKHYHCPVNGWDCPYYVDSKILDGEKEYCLCGMGFEGLNPYEECDDFFWAFAECNKEDYTDDTNDND